MTAPERTPYLHTSVLDELGSQIIEGVLAPGTRFSADEAAERRGVSRGVMREAVRVLESLGMVESRRRAGTIVLDSDSWDALNPRVMAWSLDGPDRRRQLHQVVQLRLGVEPLAARLAAASARPDERELLLAAVAGMRTHSTAANQVDYLDHDQTFHRTILKASRNQLLAQLSGVVEEVLAGRTRNALMPQEADEVALILHERVAECVQNGDGTGAEEAMRAIVEEAGQASDRAEEL